MEGRRIASVRVERSINEALEDPDNYDHD
ncbi:hypothetical protein LWS69_28535 [Bordetella hinzii]|nr:hypothetical protein [Bordetella hinzii]